METIWKFPIKIQDEQLVEMPKRSIILTVQIQGPEPYIWAIVNDDAKIINRKIRLAGTGTELPNVMAHARAYHTNARAYIGTIQLIEGNLIYHVFDEGEQSINK